MERNRILKFKIVILITFLSISFAFGQTSSYSGGFNTKNFQGTAVYKYFEKSDARTFDGSFSFSSTDKTVSITGNYINDLKNGAWKFNLTNVSTTDLLMDYKITATSSGSFLNGNLDGEWKLTRTITITFSKNGFSQYFQSNLNALSYMFSGETVDYNKTATISEKSTANFLENHFSGKFSYSLNNNKSNVTGQFNDEGYFNDTWTINYYEGEILKSQIRNYKNGVLLTVKNKDNSTGDIETVYDNTEIVTAFFENLDTSGTFAIIDNKYYTFGTEKLSEYTLKLLDDAINVWYNNNSIIKSAYIFEVERGSNEMSFYPERSVIYDYYKSEEIKKQLKLAEEKKKQEELERIKKEKEKAELLAFLEKRKTTNYNLYESNLTDYNNLKTKIENFLVSEIQNSEIQNLTLSGEIKYISDTLGIKSVDLTNLKSNNDEFLKNIKTGLEKFEINSIVEKTYKLNTYAIYKVDLSCVKGQSEFKIKTKQDTNNISYITEKPNENIDSEIQKKYLSQTEGKYQISYKILTNSGKSTSEITTISFKENKHIGRKIVYYSVVVIGGAIYLVLELL